MVFQLKPGANTITVPGTAVRGEAGSRNARRKWQHRSQDDSRLDFGINADAKAKASTSITCG